MANYQIAVIVGSLRKDSLNRKLTEALAKFAPPDFSFKFLDVGNLPLYNQDDDVNQAPVVKQFKKDVAESQGVLFTTPEYNRSVSGVLKNAIDHASRPYGQNSWAKKPAGVLGVSVGAIGTALAQQHLRNILSCLDMPAMPQPDAFLHAKEGFFDAQGNIGEGSKKFMQKWMDSYVAWIKKYASL